MSFRVKDNAIITIMASVLMACGEAPDFQMQSDSGMGLEIPLDHTGLHFKGIVLRGNLVKIEKWLDGVLIAECGIDWPQAHELWGPEENLRAEYEAWVSQAGVPEYIFIEYHDELEEETENENF